MTLRGLDFYILLTFLGGMIPQMTNVNFLEKIDRYRPAKDRSNLKGTRKITSLLNDATYSNLASGHYDHEESNVLKSTI